jgi:hypothetical protein
VSLNRYAKKRDLYEGEIIDALRHVGCSVVQLDTPVDLLVGFRGQTYLLEVKTGRKKFTPGQEEFFGAWRGGDLVLVRSVSDALEAIGV